MRKLSISTIVIGLLLRDFFLQQYTSLNKLGSVAKNALSLNAEGNLLLSHIMVVLVLLALFLYIRSKDKN